MRSKYQVKFAPRTNSIAIDRPGPCTEGELVALIGQLHNSGQNYWKNTGDNGCGFQLGELSRNVETPFIDRDAYKAKLVLFPSWCCRHLVYVLRKSPYWIHLAILTNVVKNVQIRERRDQRL